MSKAQQGDEVAILEAAEEGDLAELSAPKTNALAVIASGGLVEAAAAAAGVSTRTLHRWRQNDELFAKAWAEIWEVGTDRLEEVLSECAKKAEADPRYQTSLIFALKNRRPDKWRDAYDHRHTGAVEHRLMEDKINEGLAELAGQARKLIEADAGDDGTGVQGEDDGKHAQ